MYFLFFRKRIKIIFYPWSFFNLIRFAWFLFIFVWKLNVLIFSIFLLHIHFGLIPTHFLFGLHLLNVAGEPIPLRQGTSLIDVSMKDDEILCLLFSTFCQFLFTLDLDFLLINRDTLIFGIGFLLHIRLTKFKFNKSKQEI